MKRLLLILALLLAVPGRPATTATHSQQVSSTPHQSHHTAGTIHRSIAAKRTFERQTGYPHGRPGYVVDHVVPLACGGADDPSSMQWQTVAEAEAKDKWERRGCPK